LVHEWIRSALASSSTGAAWFRSRSSTSCCTSRAAWFRRCTIADLVRGAGARVAPIGRLDYHTSGALLCTNDGEFAQAIAHPKQGAEKEYVVKVKGIVDDAALARWRERITIDGRLTRPAEVARLRVEGDKSWLSVTLREGRNRQVRKMGEATGFPVMRLVRLAHAGVTTEGLRPGEWRYLSLDELVALKKRYGVPRKVRAAPGRTKPRPAPSRALPREKRPISRRGGRASARRPGTSR
jgi:23S rRNA pseudouridine2605 synthase